MANVMTFKNTGEDFSGYNAAEKWLRDNGYSCGPMQAGSPTGFAKGDVAISKWRNIRAHEFHLLDGRIEACDPRHDYVVVSFEEKS